MKTFSGMILGGVIVLSVSACSSTPMASDTAVGSSQSGTTAAGNPVDGVGVNPPRAATPINCTNNTAADVASTAGTPGTVCPPESK